jgi:putative transposase
MMSIFVSLVLTVRSSVRSRAALQIEVLALRHQLHVLQRSRPRRVRLTPVDRFVWVWLSRASTEWRAAIVIVKPETVIAWHRQGFRLFWTWNSRRRSGRPTVPADVRALIRTLRSRTHLALEKDAPTPRPVAPPASGRIVAIPQVSGLHHRYERRAA